MTEVTLEEIPKEQKTQFVITSAQLGMKSPNVMCINLELIATGIYKNFDIDGLGSEAVYIVTVSEYNAMVKRIDDKADIICEF